MEVYLAATHDSAAGPSMVDILLDADPIVQLVLLLLLGMSVACWAIIAQKAVRLRQASSSSAAFLDAFWQAKRMDGAYEDSGQWPQSPVAAVFQAGYRELARMPQATASEGADNVARALRRTAQHESTRLRNRITFLATTGATAPFIGLFGTVWGILRAFLKLGEPGVTATIQVVGPDIAHALVATAVGLVAAIPAVVGFNHLSSWIELLETEMDNFSADFLNLVRRR
ncbi:MAG: protein TolQ [Alphaproteobacteria bacterium]|nr:protein TolQ [Alphaproteobacteria bacterium]